MSWNLKGAIKLHFWKTKNLKTELGIILFVRTKYAEPSRYSQQIFVSIN